MPTVDQTTQTTFRRTGAVHAFDTGRLRANGTFLRGEGFGSLLRRVELIEFPALAFVIDHREGPIAIDTGLGAHIAKPRQFRAFPPTPETSADRELGPQMRAAGLDPYEVGTVVLTHLDWDHSGGVRHFPNADALVHRPEYEFVQTRVGRGRCRPQTWPAGFAPVPYDLEEEPVGPFPQSRAITSAGDVRVVAIPGHSPGQVAVTYDRGDVLVVFAADHTLRADWFEEDVAAGRHVMMGAFGKSAARESSRRLAALLNSRESLLIPSHDASAPARLAAVR